MREHNASIIIVALIVNALMVIVAMATELVNSTELFLLVWFVPNIVLSLWACYIYHKSD